MRCTPSDKHRGDDGRQTFGHGSNGQRDAQDQHIEDRSGASHLLDENQRRTIITMMITTTLPEQLAVPVELSLQRRALVLRLLQQPAMRPISVRMPVASTTAMPWP